MTVDVAGKENAESMAAQPLVWIVEDNDQNFELAEFLLDEAGFAVRRARDGRELQALVEEEAPALVLLDMHLPGASGEELLQRLRALDRFRGTPIVALTAHALRGDRERFLSLGCDGYLAKPIDIKTFVPDVERYLEARRAAGEGGIA